MDDILKEYVVLIPAYQPDENLVNLVDELRERSIRVLVVNDGSGNSCDDVFKQVIDKGAEVLVHDTNRGKGAALKTGISYCISERSIQGIVTADADGQHTIEDILKIIMGMIKHPGSLVIGARSFSGNVPFRSRFGNNITRVIFNFATGLKIADTQTGLRGLPRHLFAELAALKGERYEYEMNVLLNIEKWKVDFIEVPIMTLYEKGNNSSHFHPLRDSWQIYGKIIKFSASSFASTIIDYGFFTLFASTGTEAWLSYAAARILSSFANYMINSRIVFQNKNKSSLLKYYILAFFIMIAGSTGVEYLSILGIPELAAKIIIDLPLFLVSYTVQHRHIFNTDTMKSSQSQKKTKNDPKMNSVQY